MVKSANETKIELNVCSRGGCLMLNTSTVKHIWQQEHLCLSSPNSQITLLCIVQTNNGDAGELVWGVGVIAKCQRNPVGGKESCFGPIKEAFHPRHCWAQLGNGHRNQCDKCQWKTWCTSLERAHKISAVLPDTTDQALVGRRCVQQAANQFGCSPTEGIPLQPKSPVESEPDLNIQAAFLWLLDPRAPPVIKD